MKVAPKTSELPTLAKIGSGYETNLNATLANHCREEYARLYKQWDTLNRMHIVGFAELTIKSATGDITISVAGADTSKIGLIYTELAEILAVRLSSLEHEIMRYEKDSHEEEADEREGLGARAAVLGFCLPMRPLTDDEFLALPAEGRRAYDETGAAEVKAA